MKEKNENEKTRKKHIQWATRHDLSFCWTKSRTKRDSWWTFIMDAFSLRDSKRGFETLSRTDCRESSSNTAVRKSSSEAAAIIYQLRRKLSNDAKFFYSNKRKYEINGKWEPEIERRRKEKRIRLKKINRKNKSKQMEMQTWHRTSAFENTPQRMISSISMGIGFSNIEYVFPSKSLNVTRGSTEKAFQAERRNTNVKSSRVFSSIQPKDDQREGN